MAPRTRETENKKDSPAESQGYEIPVKIKNRKDENQKSETQNEEAEDAKNSKGVEEVEVPEKEAEKPRTKDEQITQLQEQIKRISAEFENFRRRQEKRYQETAKYAAEDVILQFFPVMDSITHAISNARESADLASLLKGLEMIKKQLADTMEKIGVEPIEAVGKTFDPAFHHAVMTEETDEYPDDTVIEELQKGYKYRDRVIRPAMVKVARNPG